MIPVRYQVVGEEDYMLDISVAANGRYVVESGSYTSQEPRKGQLSDEQVDRLISALGELSQPVDHPMPTGADAFQAHLTLGKGEEQTTIDFWEGALENDARLAAVVRELELI